ncbi:MAG: dihydrolipoamide acetyltransferase family protein [Planctomycetota bacterium]
MMLEEVLLPQLGQTMEEGTIEKWHKREGDETEKGEVLFEISTDKATLEVQAFVGGVIKKILAEEGETVPVNELVAIIGEADDKLPEDLDAYRDRVTDVGTAGAVPDKGGEESERTTEGKGPREAAEGTSNTCAEGRMFVSPRAEKRADEQKVPLTVIHGSGPNGRIVERDVDEYVSQLRNLSCTPTARKVAVQRGVDLVELAREKAGQRITKDMVMKATSDAGRVCAPGGGERVKLSTMRRTIAERMTQSKQSVPHFYLVGQVNMRRAIQYREDRNEDEDIHLTFTDFLVRAAGLALRQHPRVNAQFQGDQLVMNEHANVGVAVAVDDGLFVPVVRDADKRGLSEISDDVKSLAALAREGNLHPQQYEGGSLTISNLGTYGVDYFMPIINEPESAILGMGQIKEEVVAENGAIRIEPIMKVTVSADHRVVDGALAADFFATFRDLLENPSDM